MTVPCRIGDYTDFYTSIHHATTVGKLFRPDNPLLPNYKWVPIGYHGRASSIGVSGQRFKRPQGQTKAPDAEAPCFGPSKRLDYELELGFFDRPGQCARRADRRSARPRTHLFGVTLLNDWSARDIQAWEYQPLGPFLSKNFASTLSPWIVTMEALAPFRAPFERAGRRPAAAALPRLRPPTARAARSTSRSRSGCRPRRCAKPARPPCASRAATPREAAYWTPRSWSRTTR